MKVRKLIDAVDLLQRQYILFLPEFSRVEQYMHSEDERQVTQIMFDLNAPIGETNDAEWLYALEERVNELTKLEVKETMFFNCCRDNETEKAIIMRVK